MSAPLPRPPRHRRLIVLRGAAEATRAEAAHLTAALPPDDLLWISAAEAPPQAPVTATPPHRARRLLGRSFDAVVLDAHEGLQAEVWGQSQGFIWGGGALILCLPPVGALGDAGRDWLAAHPFTPEDVGARFAAHIERALTRAHALSTSAPLTPAPHEVQGTAEQAEVIAALVKLMRDGAPGACAVVRADRGRGKSSALGLALAEAHQQGGLTATVTADTREAAAEILRFAGDAARFIPADDLLRAIDGGGLDPRGVLLIDEAAQLPVPWLQRLAQAAPEARLLMATTARGYEGTGRGFELRFMRWLARTGRPLHTHTLRAPIRWDADDPVEAFMFDALLLDAQPSPLDGIPADAPITHTLWDREALVADEAALRGVFGLLVHAHYRTTPGDLHRLLDAPNLSVHTLRQGQAVVAVTLTAQEGALPDALTDDLRHGRRRITGHALPEALITHMSRPEAGTLRILRSVRIAAHPERRRMGLASRLVREVHAHTTPTPDLFGTLFGATADVVAFRRALGYEVCRLSASRGTRTGEPALMMLRPTSEAARRLVHTLRHRLAATLPDQLDLFAADDALTLSPALTTALQEVHTEHPDAHLTDAERRDDLLAYAFGPRTLESTITALTAHLTAHPDALAALDAQARALLTHRVLLREPWPATMRAAGLSSLPETMRAARRAFRDLLARQGLSDAP